MADKLTEQQKLVKKISVEVGKALKKHNRKFNALKDMDLERGPWLAMEYLGEDFSMVRVTNRGITTGEDISYLYLGDMLIAMEDPDNPKADITPEVTGTYLREVLNRFPEKREIINHIAQPYLILVS